MRRLYRRLLAHALTMERSLLLAIGAASGAVWAFIEIADEVSEGESRAWDRTLLLALRSAGDPASPWGPAWMHEMARDFTALGGVGVLTLLTAAAFGYLRIIGKRHAALAVLVAVIGGQLLSLALKMGGCTRRCASRPTCCRSR